MSEVVSESPVEPPNKISKMTKTDTIQSQTSVAAKKVEVDYNGISDDGSKLLVKKLSEDATLPKRGSRNAAGFDLYSAEDKTIHGRKHGIVKTDIAISIPKGSYARVAPRSGLAVKNGIDVGAGVVDYDYRGNVGVVLFNHLEEDLNVKKGDRIAQLVLEKIFMPELVPVRDLDETERGTGGFGSTGR